MHHPKENLLPSLQMKLDPPLLGASVAQLSEQAPFTSEIVGSILATDPRHLCEKSQSTLYRMSWVFSGYSWVSSHRMLTGWVGIIPLTDPSIVAVIRDQT